MPVADNFLQKQQNSKNSKTAGTPVQKGLR
jgi:hypothetical protein